MLPLTKEDLRFDQDAKVCYICGKVMLEKLAKNKNNRKIREHCHYRDKCRAAVHSICNLKFNVP